MTIDKFTEICNKHGLYVLRDKSTYGASAFLNKESSTCMGWIARYCYSNYEDPEVANGHIRVARSIEFSNNTNTFGRKGYKDIANKDLSKKIEKLYTEYRNLYKEHRKAKIRVL